MNPTADLQFNWEQLQHWLQQAEGNPVFLIADTNTLTHCYPYAQWQCNALSQCEIIELEPGEGLKDLEIATSVWQTLLEQGANKKSKLLALGGGTITDLTGFVAAGFMRGIAYVNIPTTLLGMVDAALGGKTAINLGEIKNSIGFFHPPEALLTDTAFLETLPKREWWAGWAEMLKHACIADTALLPVLDSLNPNSQEQMETVVRRNQSIKMNIVHADPFDEAQRQWLNFGHTIGHALESWALHQGMDLMHGEAVAAGIWMEVLLSQRVGFALDPQAVRQVQTMVEKHFKKVRFTQSSRQAILQRMWHDKKTHSQCLRFSLLESLGKGIHNVPVEMHWIEQVMEAYIQDYP